MKLLLIDDEPHVIEALRLLESWGKWGFDRILEANSIQRARELALQELPDLVITDILLPDGTGVDLIHTLNELPVVPQIIAVSGHSDFCYVRPALSAGCTDYLLKPIDPVDLHKAVSRAMDALQLQRQQKASREKMTQLSKMYREKLVCDLLLQRNTVDALSKLNQSLPAGTSAQCRVLLFDTTYLRTGGDAIFTMTVSIISMWLFRVILSYVFVLQFHLGLAGVWLGMFIDWLCRDICFIARFISGKWMEHKVI